MRNGVVAIESVTTAPNRLAASGEAKLEIREEEPSEFLLFDLG